MLRGLSLIVFLFFFQFTLFSQEAKEKCIWLKATTEPQVLDSLTVLPESIRINQPQGVAILFDFNLGKNEITFQTELVDSIQVCYRTLIYDLHSAKARKTLAVYDSAAPFKDAIFYEQNLNVVQREELLKTENITKTGSITRGISFGNRQDVFVNSSLNLQMEGQLTENVNLRAVISDTNIPFQPEGNTQNIQDFDNVYIELYNDNSSLLAGDVLLKNRESEFLKFYKNVQGFQFSTKYEINKGFRAETSIAGSVAKGRFHSATITPIEGVLGPYRVRGPNNERFIIVIAASERVFLDGVLLTRGFNNDYIIDYNLGEVTFTNNILITKFSRIKVDFEFSDKNYTRSIFSLNHFQTNDILDFSFNYYNEKDDKNRPLIFDLSQEEKIALGNAGDDLNNAFTSRTDSVIFNPDIVLYRKTIGIDNLGMPHEIFQHSTNPDEAYFNVQFSEVGMGQGNYILLNSTSNGRIYEWIAPINGQLQGSYEPISLLKAPNQKSMMTLGGGWKLSDYDELRLETSFSKNDLNLFSDLDSEDDNGFAYKLKFKSANRSLSFIKDYTFGANADFEYNSKDFSFIDRVRHIEFDRDWSFNTSNFTQSFSENILNANFSLTKDLNNKLSYQMSSRKRGEAVDGFQHHINASKTLGNFLIKTDLFSMSNDQIELQSDWTRFNLDLALRTSWIIPGYRFASDRNEVKSTLDNTIIRTAMNYSEHSFYLKNSDTLSTHYGLDYQIREDKLPLNGVLIDNNRSETWKAFLNTRIDKTQDLNLVLTYRNLENLRLEGSDANDETLMGRIDWNGSFLNNAFRSELTYALGNSRELRREFVFIQVPLGEGTHTWRDDNGDDIQDLNEFYIAINVDEKNYAKIFVPTDSYEEAFNTDINYRLNFRPPGEWNDAGGFKQFISQLSNSTTWTLNSKITNDDLAKRMWPIGKGINDDDILSMRKVFRSTMFYNRARAAFAADLGVSNAENKVLLVNGFQTSSKRDVRAHARWNFNRKLNLDITYIASRKGSNSDFLTSRNYLVNGTTYQPSISWQPNSFFRFTGSFAAKKKTNNFESASSEKALSNEISADFRFSKAAKRTIAVTFNFINIDFTGDENTPIGYELLEALRPGQNFKWNLNWQQKLGNGLQLNFRYDGRKSGDNRMIHTGRVQVSALF